MKSNELKKFWQTVNKNGLQYCKNCLTTNLRPNIHFDKHGVCEACNNYAKYYSTDWNARWNQLKKLCDKYRGKYGNGYDMAIAVSGGKDSHHQVKLFVEDLKMNPLLISVGNLDWTDTGRKNLYNLAETFNRDILIHNPNPNLMRRTAKIAFEELGSPTWLWDAYGYSFPWRQTIKQGLHLLVYGENVSHTYGGKDSEETPYAFKQSKNNVVKPEYKLFEKHGITKKELFSSMMVDEKEARKAKLEPIYLSYFIPWDSHLNYEVAKRYGFKTIEHEWKRQGTLEHYNQIDDTGYLLNQFLKFCKYGNGSATDFASRWIRRGLKTREEMIAPVEERDGNLDEKIYENMRNFLQMGAIEFQKIMDKWHNPLLFKKDKYGVWRKKFEVGHGITDVTSDVIQKL